MVSFQLQKMQPVYLTTSVLTPSPSTTSLPPGPGRPWVPGPWCALLPLLLPPILFPLILRVGWRRWLFTQSQASRQSLLVFSARMARGYGSDAARCLWLSAAPSGQPHSASPDAPPCFTLCYYCKPAGICLNSLHHRSLLSCHGPPPSRDLKLEGICSSCSLGLTVL